MSNPTRPAALQAGFPLARLTTLRTGGPAEWFARASSELELLALLAWATAAGVAVAVVGSGSNLLIADEGVDGLVIKLDRDLAKIEIQADARVRCGGGARLPSLAAKTAAAGLSGIEFGVNIPGTVGGAVRMNANAYEGQLGPVLESVAIATAAGVEQRLPEQLGLEYRRSALTDGEVVMSAVFKLVAADASSVKATIAKLRARRHEAQPQGIKTFGSTFKNPVERAGEEPLSAGELLARAGCNGLRVGAARFAPKHANFIENMGSARTAEVIELMAQGRSRVLESFGVALEPEVQTLGAVRFPWREER